MPSSRPSRRSTAASLALAALLGGSGCATIDTLDAAYRRAGNGPLIMSGTRFDLAALRDGERARERYGIEGPFLPWADLPLSFIFDGIVLPATIGLTLAR